MKEAKRIAHCDALLREREGVTARNPKDPRVALIYEQLRHYGDVEEVKPSKPARAKRPAKRTETR